MGKPFVNLHTHSYYSILEGAVSPKAILSHAKDLGCPAVALTDTGYGHGLVDFYEQSASFEGALKPIVGAEIFVSQDSRFERRSGIDGKEGYLVLIAKDQTGWKNLVKLLTIGTLEGLYEKPRVDWETIEKYKEGLICLTGSVDGLLGKALYERGEGSARELFQKISGIFSSKDLFLELVARKAPRFVRHNEFVLELLKEVENEVVITSNARYLNPEDEEAAETLYCIGKNFLLNAPGREKFSEENWFKSWEEMESVLSWIPEEVREKARKNSLEIAESISFELEFGKNLLPDFDVEPGETIPSQLRKNCEAQIPLLFAEDIKIPGKKQEIHDRLDYELSVIGKMGFEAYFLIVQDFIAFAKENGIAVGPGRGSAAGSIVSYLLGITTIDPLKYELLFERFLNPERISMPDIDIDFSDERRDEVLDYVIDKYGTEKVSKVCTFGTLSAKAALKDVGRALGVEFGQMNALTKLLPGTPGLKLEDALAVTDFKTKIDANPQFKKVFEIAQKLEGCVRHVSVHACAVIIGKEDLSNEVPLQWAPGTETVKITQIPYQQLEHIGLLKMDFLGLKNLSILEKTLEHIRQNTGKEIDLHTIPIDDEKTFQMIARGETTGVFQFESDGMRRYLRELKPTEFEDLVAMNALYRPGPMEYIPTYIKGKHKPKSVKYMHPVLEPILQKTYGIAVYQEQVLRIAQDFAGFSLGQADILRKAIGKKIASILAQQRQKFIDGAIEKGHDKKMAIKIFDEIIVPFSGYGFNRSHAVCYARIAYETAYLRANYPVEFMAAMMTTDRNNTDRIVLEMNECHTMEIEVLPPAVNQSGSYFSIVNPSIPLSGEAVLNETCKEKIPEKIQGNIPPDKGAKGVIRFGLSAIKGLGEDTVNVIMEERDRNGKFQSLQDFAERIPQKLINKKTLEALSFSGALDEFGDRKAIVDSIEDLSKFAREFQEKRDGGQMGLFGADTGSVEFSLKDSKADKKDILSWERESLGLFVSDHPLKGMGEYFKKFGTPIKDLSEPNEAPIDEKSQEFSEKKSKGRKKKKVVTVHGIVTNARKIFTKSGKNMAILGLEDTTGKIEIAVFPTAYEKMPSKALVVDAFLRVEGKAEERDGKMNLIADKIQVADLERVRKLHLEGVDIAPAEEERVSQPLQKIPEKSTANIQNLVPDDSDVSLFELSIPDGTEKESVDEIKQILFRSKSPEAKTTVRVTFKGKTVEIPFKIDFSKAVESEIYGIINRESDELVF